MTRAPRKPSPQAPAKIADVARLANVSVATVSRALANPDMVTQETRRKVLDAVRQTGYTPNIAARNLRVRKTMMALVVVPDIANVFFAEVLRGIDETLSAEGYGLIIANLNHSADREARYAEWAMAGQVDGVLLLCGHLIGGQGRNLNDANLPIVAVCERIPGENFPQVEINNRDAACKAVTHLLDMRHRRIAYISGPRGNILDAEREAGYRDAFSKLGMTPDKKWLCPGDFTFQSGAQAAKTIMALPEKNRPTAVFAANDEMAIGFLKTVQDAGRKVPEDFAVAGFDGIAFADFCQPALTTMVQPRRALGATAAAILADMMQGRPAKKIITQLPADIQIRGSTAGMAG